jgi:mannose-6-phosphate isomerase-like protein (cupin superfamily)
MSIRRIVTGIDGEGRSVFVSDGPPPSTGTVINAMWATDGTPVTPGDSDPVEGLGRFVPGAGGTVFYIVDMPPGTAGVDDVSDESGEDVALPGGFEGAFKPDDRPGMHITDTVDYVYIVAGEVWLEMDDGTETLVRAGDVVIQDGARHAWHNRTSEPVRFLSVHVGANRKS